jgi:predicted O-linked N-acetylglucosamine transferase (SPINDLY family)
MKNNTTASSKDLEMFYFNLLLDMSMGTNKEKCFLESLVIQKQIENLTLSESEKSELHSEIEETKEKCKPTENYERLNKITKAVPIPAKYQTQLEQRRYTAFLCFMNLIKPTLYNIATEILITIFAAKDTVIINSIFQNFQKIYQYGKTEQFKHEKNDKAHQIKKSFLGYINHLLEQASIAYALAGCPSEAMKAGPYHIKFEK